MFTEITKFRDFSWNLSKFHRCLQVFVSFRATFCYPYRVRQVEAGENSQILDDIHRYSQIIQNIPGISQNASMHLSKALSASSPLIGFKSTDKASPNLCITAYLGRRVGGWESTKPSWPLSTGSTEDLIPQFISAPNPSDLDRNETLSLSSENP